MITKYSRSLCFGSVPRSWCLLPSARLSSLSARRLLRLSYNFLGHCPWAEPWNFFSTVSALCLCVLCVCDLCVSAGCVLLPSHCSTDVTAPSRPDLAAPSHAHLAASSCAISKHLAPRGIISYQSGSTLRSRSTILCRPHSTILCHHIVLLLQHCCVAMGCAWWRPHP